MSVSFGDSIRRGREAAGLSQARVAQLIGRSPSTVRAWEQGRTNPADSGAVTAIAAVLGLDETNLLGKAGFEPALPNARRSLESELATLKTVDPPIKTMLGSPRHLGSENRNATSPEEPWIEFEKAPSSRKPDRIEPQIEALVAKLKQLKFRRRLEDRTKPAVRPEPKTQVKPVKETSVRPHSDVVAPVPPPIPVRLDPRLGALTGRSYLEDAGERDFYRRRTVGTLLVLAFLFIVLWWALRNTGGAIGELVGGFIDDFNF